MTESKHDIGIAYVLLERMQRFHLPRALRLKDKVDAGRRLNQIDIIFLRNVNRNTRQFVPLADQHPEYQILVQKFAWLLNHISDTGLHNEQQH